LSSASPRRASRQCLVRPGWVADSPACSRDGARWVPCRHWIRPGAPDQSSPPAPSPR